MNCKTNEFQSVLKILNRYCSLKRVLLGLTLLSLLITSGCASFFKQPVPEYFLLDPGSIILSRSLSHLPMRVQFVTGEIPFAGTNFVYQLTDLEWEVDAYHLFLTSPEEMLTTLFKNQFEPPPETETAVAQSEPQYQMRIQLKELYGNFLKPNDPRAVLTLEVQVVRHDQNRSEIVLQRTYSKSLPIATRTAQALVAAWNQALRLEIMALSQDLAVQVKGVKR